MPPGAIEEVGMAVWRYGGFISLTGVLKNLIAHIACAVGAQQRPHFSQHHPHVSNAGIAHGILGHVRQHFPCFRSFPLSSRLQRHLKNKPVHPEVSHSRRQVHNLI